MTFVEYLLVGSYIFSFGAWVVMWREVRKLTAAIDELRIQLARQEGIAQGQDHERRITALERP